jgi:phosphonate transport system substrate-binding protein
MAFAPTRALAGEKPIVLGVHPFLPATEIHRRFSPLADHLTKAIGRQVVIDVSRDYGDHIERLGDGRIDLAFFGPASYVIYTESYGLPPLLGVIAVKGTTTFEGVVFVREGSPVRKLGDLRGRSFAFGDRDSTMGHLVPRWMLLKAGIRVGDLGRHDFLSNHDNIALGVLVGDFDAGAVKAEIFDKYRPRGIVELVRTPRLADHVFAAGQLLPDETVRALRQAMLAIGNDPEEAARILDPIHAGMTAIRPARDSDYENLRTIMRELKENGDLQ